MKYRCAECKTINDCKHAFGIYWAYRSHMGQGCDLQFAYKKVKVEGEGEQRTVRPFPVRKFEQMTI